MERVEELVHSYLETMESNNNSSNSHEFDDLRGIGGLRISFIRHSHKVVFNYSRKS